ncbi:MAG: hypothetical protein RR922_00830 [Clostridia bacterium]
MGNVYSVPRNVKGETRILFIFTVKSFMTTVGGGAIGGIFYLLFAAFGFVAIGLGMVVLCAIMGYLVGTLTIPDSPIMGKLRKAGGEEVGTILLRTIFFSKKKKLYVYKKGETK